MSTDRSKSGLQLLAGHTTARFIGSATAGILELVIFHPVDTVAKRLMTNKDNIRASKGGDGVLRKLSQVVFKEAYNKPLLTRYLSLFPGFGFAAGYKVSQRIYKFGGQPIVNDFLNVHCGTYFRAKFGDKKGKTMLHATAGSLIGVGEIILLPLDVLKIRAQTNPAAIGGKGVLHIFRDEGHALYRGALWTAARNAPGSFALFGGSAATKEYLFQLKNYNDATFAQNFVASVAGSTASVTVAQPLDVIKTRIQSRAFASPQSGIVILKNLLAEEGVGALFKGLIPKLGVVGPKLVFSFTIAQHLIAFLEKGLVRD